MMQGLLSRLGLARKAPESSGGGRLPVGEQSWSELSLMYSGADFNKYNPDDLVGRKGFGVYRRMMLDEQVKAVVKFKRDAITSRDFYFKLDPDRAGLSQEEADRRVAICEEVVGRVEGSFGDKLNGILSAVYNGFSMTEKVFNLFEYDGLTWWGLQNLKLRPFDTFYFGVDDYGNVERLLQKIGNREQRLDPAKFIHFVQNPDVDDHFGQSELREAYRAWFSKDNIIKFRNIWLERHAAGFRWAQPKEDKTLVPGSPAYEQLKDALTRTQTGTSAILPGSIEYHVSYPNDQVAYGEAIKDCDLAISRALLIPNLLGITPSGQTGSYSQSDTQLEAFFWTLDADAKRLEDALNEQLFDELNAANFGDGPNPRFKFKPVSEKKKLEIIRTWRELVQARAVRHTDTDEAHVRELLDFPEAGEEVGAPSPDSTQPGQGDQPGQGEETVAGRGLVSVSAFQRALKRVDFAVIDKSSEAVVDEGARRVAEVQGQLVREAVSRVEDKKLGTGDGEEDLAAIRGFKLSGGLVAKLRRATKVFLRQGWDLGAKHAAVEVDKAKGRRHGVDRDRMDFIEEKFFDLRSFQVTGNLTDRTLALIKNVLINGAKTGKSTEEVVRTIYEELAAEGMLSLEDAREALGDALGVDNPDARLRTVVRTNTFESLNEARYSYFTDPGLGGFVEALEYSAILDSRTTAICEHLDGQVHAADSDVWTNYRPPNHYNCRSLLVPVTKRDSWKEDAPPSLDPQRGFS